jgi:hypothetical protein
VIWNKEIKVTFSGQSIVHYACLGYIYVRFGRDLNKELKVSSLLVPIME